MSDKGGYGLLKMGFLEKFVVLLEGLTVLGYGGNVVEELLVLVF
jgi:hypothetical protein